MKFDRDCLLFMILVDRRGSLHCSGGIKCMQGTLCTASLELTELTGIPFSQSPYLRSVCAILYEITSFKLVVK